MADPGSRLTEKEKNGRTRRIIRLDRLTGRASVNISHQPWNEFSLVGCTCMCIKHYEKTHFGGFGLDITNICGKQKVKR